jgi:hypothetical protein
MHLAQTEIERFERGEVALYVWGIVYYSDGFVTGRYTKFCHRYEADCMEVN